MSESRRGVIPVRRPMNPGQGVARPSSSSQGRTTGPQPLRQQPPVRRPAPTSAAVSKLNRPPVKKASDETGLTAVFGQLDLEETEKENSARVPEQMLKQVGFHEKLYFGNSHKM
jgi:hypothetical protein